MSVSASQPFNVRFPLFFQFERKHKRKSLGSLETLSFAASHLNTGHPYSLQCASIFHLLSSICEWRFPHSIILEGSVFIFCCT
jgi:hypothetical protein